ncbi:hypothetical protein PTNB73_04080 [Pyrenophora teres f. teres]|uniref:Mtf2-like C-terminal domain-containing protein n=2 Tax=Pyrenophora teres f. teres TaxID=97479 RepID=E3RZG5_PYRTT|nr:hypothetical protein PTT_15042 [Pyrenophora teres f. teres 0-1]KAE8837912.1 hypothetical protein PTNB85_05247 [Pyrenophora teres f. teres]KAE8839667.1 hypothetical protein HRS9122_06272 [Pyrenophora teres f. teres]KAE8862735.1 hypothetical protein PTNB29_05297 [Pyrenophora teres f. teres]KAE8869027.1 hypothetical protein PTNB73_04080 [Pyrenophora teres f. teres]
MSVCSNAIRAVSRSRIPPSKTLLPFLYQTQTIQQWQPATRPIARRNITSRSRPANGDDVPFADEIPFDDADLPPPIDQERSRKTTITSTERAAFQKLYKRFTTEGRQQKEKDHVIELDQIADEYYEDEEDSSKPSLDKVFNEAMQGQPRVRAVRTEKIRAPRKQAQTSKEDGVDTPPTKAARSRRERGDKVDATKFKEMRLAERERIDNLLRTAPTDRALWQILDREVFIRVRDLDLDNANTGETTTADSKKKQQQQQPPKFKSQTSLKPDPPTTEASILFQNYPHHLITAIHTLRTEFPSSPLPLSILPTIKNLGRSSHALGGTPALYKNLIRTAWIQQSSYMTIDSLLTEMDHHAIEFDADILALLQAIIKENHQAYSGVLGKEMQMVLGMDMFVEGIDKIEAWEGIIAKRLGVRSEEKRNADKVVRRVLPEKEKLWRGIGVQEEKSRDSRGHKNASTSTGQSRNSARGDRRYNNAPRDGFNDAFTTASQGRNSGKGGRRHDKASTDGFNDAFTLAQKITPPTTTKQTTASSTETFDADVILAQAIAEQGELESEGGMGGRMETQALEGEEEGKSGKILL